MEPREAVHEARQREADRVALEQAEAARHDAGVPSPGYVHAVHPDHGEPVVFVPGQLLPSWAAKALAAQRPEADAHNVYRIDTAPKGRRAPGKERT